MASGKSTVLYVEDEESDRLLMRLAFQEAGVGPELRTVSDGQSAIDYLAGTGVYGDTGGTIGNGETPFEVN